MHKNETLGEFRYLKIKADCFAAMCSEVLVFLGVMAIAVIHKLAN